MHHAAWLSFWNELAGVHGRATARGRALHRSEPASRGRRAQRHPHAVRVPGAVVGDARHRAAAPRPAARRVSRARCADVHGARRQGAGPHGRRGLEHRTRRPQPAPCGRAQAPRAVHAERVGKASRDGAAGSSGVLQRLPPRPHGSRARRGGQAAGRRRQVQGPPLLQP